MTTPLPCEWLPLAGSRSLTLPCAPPSPPGATTHDNRRPPPDAGALAGLRPGLRRQLAALPAPLRLGRRPAGAEEGVPLPHRRRAGLARLGLQRRLRRRPG